MRAGEEQELFALRIALSQKFADWMRSAFVVGPPGPGTDARCRGLYIALAVLVAAVPLAHSPIAPVTLKWAIMGALIPLIAALWLWGGCGRSFRPLPKLVAPLLTLLLVAGLSLFQAVNLTFGLQRIAVLLVLFLLYLVVTYSCARPDAQERLVQVLVLTLLLVSVLSLYGCTMGCTMSPPSPGETLFRLFWNTSYGAAYLLTVIPLSVALFLDPSGRWQRDLWGTTVFLSMVVLTLSMVRGAWVSIWIGFAVLAWVFFDRERRFGPSSSGPRLAQLVAVLLLGSAVLVGYLLWPLCLPGSAPFGERALSILDLQQETLQVRVAFWEGTLRLIREHRWAGVGIGNFPIAFVPYRPAAIYRYPSMQVEHPHNEYLNAWAELGLLGVLTLVWLGVRIVRLGCRLATRADARKEIVAGVLGGLAASAAYAHLFYVVHLPSSAVNIAILLGLLDGMDHDAGPNDPARRGIRLRYVVPGVLVMALLCYQYFLRPMAGEMHYYLAEKYFRGRQIEAGLNHLDRSLEWDPQSPAVRFRRAAVLLIIQRYTEAIQEAREALKVHPNFEIAYGVMASAYLRLGDKAKAKELFLRAEAVNPHYPYALNNLGVIAAQEDRIAEAEALFLRSKEVMGLEEMSPYANLGNIYEMTGRMEKALQMYETAVTIKPLVSSNWYTVARLKVRTGDPSGAYGPLARAIALDERWRARARRDTIFAGLRRSDPRVQILLQLD